MYFSVKKTCFRLNSKTNERYLYFLFISVLLFFIDINSKDLMINTSFKQIRDIIKMAPELDIPNIILKNHCALVPSQNFSFSQTQNGSLKRFVKEWDALEVDTHMADNGRYRLRRYGVFYLSQKSLHLDYQSNATFYQSLESNPINGGINRGFSSLSDSTIQSHFLHALIRLDFKNLPNSITCKNKSWKIGVHQIKIKSFTGRIGLPTPEGIHRDDENFTVQHLIDRHNIASGENLFYGQSLNPSKEAEIKWLQKDFFDSYYFDKSVWHSVSPVESLDGINEGYRDVLLLDFVPRG